MEITAKIRKDLVLLKCYARPNKPRQAERRADEGDINLKKVNGAKNCTLQFLNKIHSILNIFYLNKVGCNFLHH